MTHHTQRRWRTGCNPGIGKSCTPHCGRATRSHRAPKLALGAYKRTGRRNTRLRRLSSRRARGAAVALRLFVCRAGVHTPCAHTPPPPPPPSGVGRHGRKERRAVARHVLSDAPFDAAPLELRHICAWRRVPSSSTGKLAIRMHSCNHQAWAKGGLMCGRRHPEACTFTADPGLAAALRMPALAALHSPYVLHARPIAKLVQLEAVCASDWLPAIRAKDSTLDRWPLSRWCWGATRAQEVVLSSAGAIRHGTACMALAVQLCSYSAPLLWSPQARRCVHVSLAAPQPCRLQRCVRRVSLGYASSVSN